MAKHKLRGAQYYTFLPIPHALRYEVNCLGDVRNRKTGYILKWYLNPHNTKQLTLIDNHGKKITATFPHLLWLVHGQLKGKCSAVPVTIEKAIVDFALILCRNAHLFFQTLRKELNRASGRICVVGTNLSTIGK